MTKPLPPDSLSALLRTHSHTFGNVVPVDWRTDPYFRLDLSASNPELAVQNFQDTSSFNDYVFAQLTDRQAIAAVGGYLEDRAIYRRSPHFNGSEPRTIHLGIDIWMPAGTPVFAPLPGKVHSFRDNDNFGDYGPTIILAHELENRVFYTLYGHLSRESLQNLHGGQSFVRGEMLGQIGGFPENGDWPPHLHFQVVADMRGHSGDFPGVAARSERENYRQCCPDPNIILGIPDLHENPGF